MPIYTVSQISDAIKKTLEGSFDALQIRGEISNLRIQASGHYYFTLKDAQSQLSCALFRGDASRLKTRIKDGDQIVASGNLSVFAPKGTYQLIVKSIEHQGLGDLLIKLEALKTHYRNKGYFDSAIKKPLPKFPAVIGVITSSTGAVIQDIIQTLSRRHKGFKLLLIPTKVQGEGSAEEISKALDFMNLHNLCDVIICGRGGGSLEDMWCFNEAVVVEAIYRSKIPVISAVGHETDFTLADFVADVRAPTPTAAAELALYDLEDFFKSLRATTNSINNLFYKKISHENKLLDTLKKRPEFLSPSLFLQSFYFSLDRIEAKLQTICKQRIAAKINILLSKKSTLNKLSPASQLRDKKAKLSYLKQKLFHTGITISIQKTTELSKIKDKLDHMWPQLLQSKKTAFHQVCNLLNSIHPNNVLNIGYAIIESLDGKTTYASLAVIKEDSDLRIKLKDGTCLAHVTSKSLSFRKTS